jgi:hypothetical protein
MNKLPKIFLPIIALFVITDTYAGVADGLDKRMNPQEPVVQKPKVKHKPIPRKPNPHKTHHHHHDDKSELTPIINPEPLPLPLVDTTINHLKNSWLKEEHADQTNLYVHINQTNVDSLLKSFVDGTIELGQPSVGYKDYRHKFWEFNTAKDWDSLAKVVIEGGANQDIDWFYLGRSAEGLKLYKAANSYYAKGLSATSKCEKTPTSTSNDGCDGFGFPQVIEVQIKNLIFLSTF